MSDPLVRYYSDRAREYDRIYEKPERQDDLRELRSFVASWAAGRRVLELACGTGYWSEVMAATARFVVATDVNESVLDVARAREDPRDILELRIADALRPQDIAGDFDAIFAGFWLSHLRRRERLAFVDVVSDRLAGQEDVRPAAASRATGDGAGSDPARSVLLIDNRYVDGSSTPISRRDATGDTYQLRRLDGGEEFEVLKNFPSRRELIDLIASRRERGDLPTPRGARSEVRELSYYWIASWEVV